MITINNTLPDLFPAFNKSLVEVESVNIFKEKHNFIIDILTDKTIHPIATDSFILGFPSLVAIGGGVGTSSYTAGDYVLVNVVSGSFDYSGIHKVVAVPNDSAVVIDTPFLGTIGGGDIEVYRIYRNKLPANPEGNAIFDVNGYATGLVSEDFRLDNTGIFNVPNSFDRFQFLASEEYYQNLTYQQVQDNGGFAQLVDVSEDVFIGQTLQVISDTALNTLYNGIYQVTEIEFDGFGQRLVTLNRAFTLPSLTTGQLITLPKVAVWRYDLNDLSDEKLIFNSALPYPRILDFDGTSYDMSLFQNAPFLNDAPELNKIKLNQRSYTQFYQSVNTTATQFIVQVIDEFGVQHDYIIQSLASPDNFLGIAVGTYDLNQLNDPSQFIQIPPRGLPIIQECDSSYCVSLYGEDLCDINGLQTTNFVHPYSQVLNSGVWVSTNADSMNIEVLDYEVGGVPQTITPTGTNYSQAVVTAQTEEEIYSNEIGLQTGLNIQSSDAFGSGLINGHWIEVDHNQDFYLRVRLRLFGTQFLSGINILVEYRWDSATCQTTYRVLNGIRPVNIGKEEGFIKPTTRPIYSQNLKGWQGLQSNPTNPLDISSPICFDIDYKAYAYEGARLLFQDRLGSFVGYNFSLKDIRRQEASSDGFEVDRYQVGGLSSISRGFKTIQFSYSEEWDLNADFMSEEDFNFCLEALTSPNVFVEYKGEVLPCIVKPKTETILTSKNNDLRSIAITIRVNGTQYSQRN